MRLIQGSISESAGFQAYIQDNIKDVNINRLRPIVVICPGGGYIDTADREAEPVALAYLYKDYHAVILRYTTDDRGNAHYPNPLLDLAKMIQVIHKQSQEWQIDTKNIILAGFSAGGHLVLEYAANWHTQWMRERSSVENDIMRPAMVIAGYPVCDYYFTKEKAEKELQDQCMEGMPGITKYQFMCRANEALLGTDDSETNMKRVSQVYHVTSKMPPVFMWATAADNLVFVGNTLRMGLALEEHHIPFETHIFQKGLHGLSMATGATGDRPELIDAAQWFELSVKFIERNKN